MFCPQCKAEYRAGFTQCSDCGVALVETLTAAGSAAVAQETKADSDARELFWSGYDPRIFQQFQMALHGAGIEFTEQSQAVRLGHSKSVRPMEIWTYLRDHSVAEKVYAELTGSGGPAEESETEAAEDAAAIPEDSSVPADSIVPDDITEEIRPEEVTAEAWAGDASMREILEACLRENGIASAGAGDGKTARILVRPEKIERAKEIIREVTEATPPE
jgi:hypothetical protein